MTDQTETHESAEQVIVLDDSLNDHHIRGLELAYAALIADLGDSAHPDRWRSAGWRPSLQLNNAVTCDQLVKKGYMQADPTNKKTTPLQNRYRIAPVGCAAIGKSDPRQTKPATSSGDTSYVATLTSPELTPDETRKAQIIADVMGFDDDDDDEAAPDFTITPLEEVIETIDGIVAAAIGHQQPVEITHVADNVQALADAYFVERGRAAAMTLEIDKLTRQINALKLAADQARHALPMPNELTDLRAQVKRLEEENAHLRAVGTRPAVSAPAAPKIEIMYFTGRVSRPDDQSRTSQELASLLADGWVIKYEAFDFERGEMQTWVSHHARLERNKPTDPQPPLRAAVEAPAPVGVSVTPVIAPGDHITIRIPEPTTVPMNFTAAMAAYRAGEITMDEALAAGDAAALVRGRQAYESHHQPVSRVAPWEKQS